LYALLDSAEEARGREGVMGEEELKPCPFCGKAAKVETITDIFHHTTFMAVCGNDSCGCHPMTEPFEKSSEAVAAWNRRVEA
jgi:Lar family restriction alleviation protein